MVQYRNPFKRQDSVSGGEILANANPPALGSDEKNAADGFPDDSKSDQFNTHQTSVHGHENPADENVHELDAKNLLANGKERPIETAEDIATR